MAYTVRPHEIAYFSRHRWGETPSHMVQSLLVRTLEATGRFSVVLARPYTGSYSYSLRTEILELTQAFTAEPPALRLSLRLQLSSEGANGKTVTREISIQEPMQAKTPGAGVIAANEATAKALQEVAGFLLPKKPLAKTARRARPAAFFLRVFLFGRKGSAKRRPPGVGATRASPKP